MKLNEEPDVRWLEGYERMMLFPLGTLIHPSAWSDPEKAVTYDYRTSEVKPMESTMVSRRSPFRQAWFDEQAMRACGLTAKDLK